MVGHRLGSTKHVGDYQVRHRHQVIALNDPAALLVVEVPAPVRDLAVRDRLPFGLTIPAASTCPL
jgi:hypothetical protein